MHRLHPEAHRDRSTKPRANGLSAVIDDGTQSKGMIEQQVQEQLEKECRLPQLYIGAMKELRGWTGR